MIKRILWVAVMVAFVGAATLAVLPHSHTEVLKAHDCLLCRAQSVHPSLASQTPAIVPLVLEGQAAPPLLCPLFAQNLFFASLCRAPPRSRVIPALDVIPDLVGDQSRGQAPAGI